MTDPTPKPFDPSRFLTLVSGKEYLEVKYRIQWFRSEWPEGTIETELVSHHNNEAVVKATVTKIKDGEVRGRSSDYGSEDAQGFGDYLEKASTKSIGRALASLGYGTQFCGDHDFGAHAGRVVDSPVEMRPRQSGGSSYGDRPASGSDLAATDRQRNLIQALAREQKLSVKALDELSRERTGKPFGEISRQNASTIIEYLRSNQPPRGAQSA